MAGTRAALVLSSSLSVSLSQTVSRLPLNTALCMCMCVRVCRCKRPSPESIRHVKRGGIRKVAASKQTERKCRLAECLLGCLLLGLDPCGRCLGSSGGLCRCRRGGGALISKTPTGPRHLVRPVEQQRRGDEVGILLDHDVSATKALIKKQNHHHRLELPALPCSSRPERLFLGLHR